MKRVDRVVIEKMIVYCKEIDQIMDRFGRDFDVYCRDRAYQYATAMCILQIGELVTRLSGEVTENHPEIPWRLIRGMRNFYAHDYERTKPETMWQTLTEDVPALQIQLQELLEEDE
ncbi:MAG: DUF86 domain-containing protein [Clostridia bacterium]|nr:DUF86 domain-containing protein [Clostridia bacterium]